MMKLIATIGILFISLTAYGQLVRKSEVLRRMDLGKDLMETGAYDSAQVHFLFALEHMEKLPSEMAYYFGRNSFHIKKYKQSINWLNKYIQLKGTKGRYYEPAVKYLQYAEDEYITIQRSQARQLREDLENSEYDCGGLEKMLCPVCHGSGVVISAGTFDNIYRTCAYCIGDGFLPCDEYNQFMKGELAPKTGNRPE